MLQVVDRSYIYTYSISFFDSMCNSTESLHHHDMAPYTIYMHVMNLDEECKCNCPWCQCNVYVLKKT